MNKDNEDSFVSVIMPIKNEERYIERTLRAVLNQNYPLDKYEILIVDGNSTYETREKISEISSGSKVPVLIIDNPTGVVPIALNLGLKKAKGEIVVRVDGHCEIQWDYISTCVSQLLNGKVDCVGGSIDTIGDSVTAHAIALAMRSPFGVGGVDFRIAGEKSKFTDTVPFPAYKREIFDKIGLFDEEMLCNEDDEFNYRLLKSNGQILLHKNLRTRYYSRGSLASLWKQYFRYGLWKVRILQKHPQQIRPRQFVPLTFVFGITISFTMALIAPWGWVLLLGLLGIYTLVNLLVSVYTAWGKRCGKFWLLPVIYVIIHVGYGLGFLIGLVKFWDHWAR